MEGKGTHVLFICVSISLLYSCHGLNTQGRSFALAFLDSEVERWQDIPLEVWVINSGSSSATVTISAPRNPNLLRMECTGDKTVTISPGDQHMFGVCWYAKIFSSDSSINNKVIRVDSDQDVSVMAVNKEAFSGDSYQILPISSLGTAYYPTVASDSSDKANMLAVVSTQDETSVTVSLPLHATGPQVSFVHRCMVYEGGSTFTINLANNEVFYIMDLADISGTKVVTSKPAAVFSGNVRAHLPNSDESRDHICEQAISAGRWDNEYVYVPIDSASDDFIRLTAAIYDVEINWSADDFSSGSFTVPKGEFMDFNPFGKITHFVSTSGRRFSAVMYSNSVIGESGIERDPVMLNLQGLNQWVGSYTLPPLYTAQSTLDGGAQAPYSHNFLMVLTASSSVNGLRIDGAALPSSVRNACRNVPNSGLACQLDVDGSVSHILTHASGDSFGAFMFSSDDRESLSTTLGLTGSSECEETVMIRGDAVDNDCDGNFDEEPCDGIDNDSDGAIDEDCASSSGRARGKTYLITFLDNSKSDGSASDLDQLQIYISPQSTITDATVKVSNPRGSFEMTTTLQRFNTTVVEIPTDQRLPQESGVFDRSILLEATDDVVVYAINKIKFSSESFLALPVDGIGYDYYVATITVKDANDVATFAVCAADPGTTTLEITLADVAGVNVAFEGTNYRNGDTIRPSLLQYQCLQMQSPTDLTGSRVQSTNGKRIAVFSGNRRPVVGNEGNARDHIVEQMIAVPSWGRNFYTIPIQRDGSSGNTRGDIFRIITSQDDTTLTLTPPGVASLDEPVVALKGQYRELEVGSTEYIHIEADKPVLVVQYSKTQLNSNQDIDKGDPSMTLVIAKESWANDYRFVTPRSGQLGDNGEYVPYVSKLNIAIETDYISNLRYGDSGIPFSDAFPSAQWVEVDGSAPSVSATTVRVEFGMNYVTSINNDIRFSAVVYGAADREFYANPVSLQLSQTLCSLTSQSLNDLIDNDCDSAIDEEYCNGYDDDDDGLVDEDCASPPDGSQGSYLFIFMENTVEYPIVNPLTVMVTPTCSGSTGIRLRTPNARAEIACDSNTVLTPDSFQRFTLQDWFKPIGTSMSDMSVLVESTCPVSVVAYNMDKFSADAFMVLPRDMLGDEYRTMSFYPVTLGSMLSVVAAESATVQVTIPNHIGNSPRVRHPMTNVSYSGGQSFTVALAQFQAMQLVADEGDLSGTVIRSSGNNVAVFSGNIRVGIDSSSRDHIVEQLPPWSKASNDWVVVANGMTDTEIVKFTCDPGVTISFPGTSNPVFTFSATGEVAQVEISRFYSQRVTANGNCQLFLITISQSSKNAPLQGDPSMSLIVPTAQYISSVKFSVPAKPWRKLSNGQVDDYKASLVIVARSSQVGAIRLDGVTLSGWESVDGTYSVTRVEIAKKVGVSYSLTSDNGELFDARLWAIADRESIAVPLGMQ
ncbi:uncharacterized protein [Watersipora subatra]|uniref:uncharacterized protein n=1 Tax=Watersipora subatra TaxID=2589382 RepID=UPI00355C89E1